MPRIRDREVVVAEVAKQGFMHCSEDHGWLELGGPDTRNAQSLPQGNEAQNISYLDDEFITYVLYLTPNIEFLTSG